MWVPGSAVALPPPSPDPTLVPELTVTHTCALGACTSVRSLVLRTGPTDWGCPATDGSGDRALTSRPELVQQGDGHWAAWRVLQWTSRLELMLSCVPPRI